MNSSRSLISQGGGTREASSFYTIFYVKFDYFAKNEKLFLKRLSGIFALLLRLHFFFKLASCKVLNRISPRSPTRLLYHSRGCAHQRDRCNIEMHW